MNRLAGVGPASFGAGPSGATATRAMSIPVVDCEWSFALLGCGGSWRLVRKSHVSGFHDHPTNERKGCSGASVSTFWNLTIRHIEIVN
jgi:hypothetical protein